MKNRITSLIISVALVFSSISFVSFASEPTSVRTPYQSGEESAPTPIGAGSEEDPYRIYTKAQLAAFSETVKTEPSASAVLMADIVYNEGVVFTANTDTGLIRVEKNGAVGYIGTGVKGIEGGNTSFDSSASLFGAWYTSSGDGFLKAQSPVIELEEFSPISSSDYYRGTFDGNGHTVKGIYVNSTVGRQGFFSKLGSGAIVKDLTVEASAIITSAAQAGAIAGYMYADESTKVEILNCKNRSTVIVAKRNAAGILGYQDAASGMQNYPIVTDSISSGTVMAAESYVGGIMGGSTRGNLTSSYYGALANYGEIYAYDSYAAGITPTFVNGVGISNAYNEGRIYAKRYAAGIAAQTNRATGRCVNIGDVTATDAYAAGIVCNNNENNQISYCANLGAVTADSYAAGIVSGPNRAQRAPKISYCYNSGEIYANYRVGGICSELTYEAYTTETTDADGNVTVKQNSVKMTLSHSYSTPTVSALSRDCDPIVPYVARGADNPIGCEVIDERDVSTGALCSRFSSVFSQMIGTDAFPVPNGKAAGRVYEHQTGNGYLFYSNSEVASHGLHVNKNEDCRCDVCSYTYPEKHTNLDGDCLCDICGESDFGSHDFTSGGICRRCGEWQNPLGVLESVDLSLGDRLTLGVYMRLSETVLKSRSAYLRFKLGGRTVDAPISDSEERSGLYLFRFTVSAKQLSETFTVQIMNSSTGSGAVYSYSVESYLDSIEDDPTLSSLVSAARHWALAAQICEGYSGEELIRVEGDLDGVEIPASSGIFTEGGIDGLTHHITGISVTDSLSVRFVFSGIDGVTFLYNGRRVEPEASGLGRYAIELRGIDPLKLSDEITLTALKAGQSYTVKYSIFADIAKRIDAGLDSKDDMRLYRAICNYIDELGSIKGIIVYNMNGGSVETDVLDFEYGEATKLPSDGVTSPDGSVFVGWFSNPECTDMITEIPRGAVGSYNVYALFRRDHVEFDFTGESSDAEGTLEYSEGGASFIDSGSALYWTASSSGSFITARSAIGSLTDTLPEDGYVSYTVKLRDVSMDTEFGLLIDGAHFTFFRTEASGRLLFGDTELQPKDGIYTVRLMLRPQDGEVLAYLEDGELIGSLPLKAEHPLKSELSIDFARYLDAIDDAVFTMRSLGEGSISLLGVKVCRGHLFRPNGIDYVIGDGVFEEGYEPPSEYAISGEGTKLPSPDKLTSKTGEFIGWYLDPELTVPIDSIPSYLVGITKVYARYNMIFLDIDYSREDAKDPDMYERPGSASGNGLSYNIYGTRENPDGTTERSVGTYKILTDRMGRKYLLCSTEQSGSQITGIVANKYANITSSDLSISFEISIGGGGEDYIPLKGDIMTPEGELREITNVIDDSKLTSTYLRLRTAESKDALYVFTVSSDGVVKMGNVTLGSLDLKTGEPMQLRIVADFKTGELISYDENGEVEARTAFSVPSGTGAKTHEELLRLLTNECFCMRLNDSGAGFRLYSVLIREGNKFENAEK